MKKRVPYGQLTSHADTPSQMWQGHAGTPHQGAPLGGRRLADLFGMDVQSPELLNELRRIHWSARQVIGGNLGRQLLERSTLERLLASVVRQADQARKLEVRIIQAGAGLALQEEIAALREFYERAQTEIEEQLKPAH